MGDFSHLTENAEAHLVNITGKQVSTRVATVRGQVSVSATTIERLDDKALREIISVARVAGIQGAKKTWELVPLCHQIPLTGIDIKIELRAEHQAFEYAVTCKTESQTGVEMEAMTAAAMVGITIYDMIKAVNPEASIGPFTLVRKEGGKSGVWKSPQYP